MLTSNPSRPRPGVVEAAGPAFSNRHRSFSLIERGGVRCIVYRQPGGRHYPPHVLEAAEVVRAHPCRWMPRVYEVSAEAIVGEYLEGFVPLGKVGVTSSRWRGFYLRAKRRGRFRRRHLMPYLRSMVEHWDRLVGQMRETAGYLREHGLWHDDVMPQNVMWHRELREMRLVDIGAMTPRRLIDDGTHPPYFRRREEEGVFRLDYTVDEDFLRVHFMRDFVPWWRVWWGKMGVDRYWDAH